VDEQAIRHHGVPRRTREIELRTIADEPHNASPTGNVGNVQEVAGVANCPR
jgi:hypothetical protein